MSTSSLPPRSIDPTRRIGQLVANRYELAEVVGSGGQGAVYRAHDRVAGDEVALKVLTSRDPDAVERMFREAQVMSQLVDTAAVRVLHQARTGDGALCLVMELLRGEDLGALLERHRSGGAEQFTAGE